MKEGKKHAKEEILQEISSLKGTIIDLYGLDNKMEALGGGSIFSVDFVSELIENKNPSWTFFDKEQRESFDIMIEFVYVDDVTEKELDDMASNENIDSDDIFNYLYENKIDVKITDVTEL